MPNRSRYLIFGCVLSPIALYLGASMTMDRIDRTGWTFFNRGKAIVSTLGRLAQALQTKDLRATEAFYDARFSGNRLGLTNLDLAEQKDGIRKYRLRSDGNAPTRDAAIAEWRAYLDGFASIEEAGIHVHRLERWDSPDELVAS